MNLLVEFLKQNTMMNDRLVDACAGLTAEQLDATVDGTYGTIGATLVHIANGQVTYTSRFFGEERPPRLADAPFPGMEALRAAMAQGNARLEEAAAIGDDGRRVEVQGDDPEGTWSMAGALLLIQAVNHATEHRSQVATILTQLGVEPPDMSGWAFFFDGGHLSET